MLILQRFDLYDSLAIMCEGLSDCQIICNDRIVWQPLENILEAWTSMIENDKTFVTTEPGDDKFPWRIAPYSEQILQDTITAFGSWWSR
jgi:hypothetical protein